MSRPVSWLLIERGHSVVGRDGEEIGEVVEVLGDEGNDIFNGLTVRSSLLGAARYVPAERIAEITTGTVTLDLTADEFDALDEHGPQGT